MDFLPELKFTFHGTGFQSPSKNRLPVLDVVQGSYSLVEFYLPLFGIGPLSL